jgi:DNA-binding LytR/AlgR family response regulator
MRVAICDDDPNDAAQIRALLLEHFEKNGYTGEIRAFASGEALLAAFAAAPFDSVFLDIYMGGLDGMKTAKRLRELDADFALVFVTTSRDHAMESFSHRPSYYVPKPIGRRDIDNAFRQCQNVFLKNARFVEVISDRAKVRIPYSKILYIETFGRETLFHTTGGEIKTTAHLPLDELERTLGNAFLRCHRSYIVNLNHVQAAGPEDFKLRGGGLVPMRQRGRAELREAYADFVSDRLFEVPS